MGEDFLSEGQFNIEVVEKEKIRISVRNLVEFVFRSGDIDNRVGKGVQKEAMQQGSRMHRKIQKTMGAEYRAEVPLKHEMIMGYYMLSVENKNDTPSIRYRIGYISYNNEEYDNALVSFINAVEKNPLDTHVLLALGNTLAKKGDNFAALGYYRRLVAFLDKERTRHEILFPQVREDQYELVDMYCKATNNSGVVLYRLAKQTGQSTYIAEAQVNLSDSIRAYDALTRNMDTFMRIEGSNLAAENSKYMSQLMPQFDPEIYTDIPMILSDESMPE